MNNHMYMYTRKKPVYAYIYMLEKFRALRTHPPHKSSKYLASQACPIIY